MKQRTTTTIFAVATAVIIATFTVIVMHRASNDNNMAMQMQNGNMRMPDNAVATNKVAISNYMFSPTAIKIRAGATVTWTNNDQVHHTVTVDNGSGPASSEIGHGQTYSYTFKKVGTYTYHCMPHPYMHGTIVVTN